MFLCAGYISVRLDVGLGDALMFGEYEAHAAGEGLSELAVCYSTMFDIS